MSEPEIQAMKFANTLFFSAELVEEAEFWRDMMDDALFGETARIKPDRWRREGKKLADLRERLEQHVAVIDGAKY